MTDACKDNNAGGVSKVVAPEMRRSERLRKEIHLTTMQKVEATAKKRCLEGNPKDTSMIIADESVKILAKSMGVMVQSNDFTTLDLIKNIKNAKESLLEKHRNIYLISEGVENTEFVPNLDDEKK